jgi:hypothetical protein
MSKPNPGPASSSSVVDTLTTALESFCKAAAWAGIAAMVIGIGFLLYTFSVVGGGSSNVVAADAMSNIDIFGKVLLGGSMALILALTFLYWGEETLGVLQLVGAGALYFAPLFVPQIFGVTSPTEAGSAALGAMQTAGMVTGGIAVVVLVADLITRIRVRSQQGMRAEALKYGKGIKEERDIQNVFLGKCWQLPFCRKFVRERCPIYHSRRTCWKEQVGCMCEEQVIRDAMEGKVIPKDALAATQYIPRNTRLTSAQKFERCKQCVIYNEHQKHKYKAILPAVGIGFVLFYVLMRGPLLTFSGGIIEAIDRMIGRATFQPKSGVSETITQSGLPFHEILLVCIMVILFAYTLRLLEFLVFKLKV